MSTDDELSRIVPIHGVRGVFTPAQRRPRTGAAAARQSTRMTEGAKSLLGDVNARAAQPIDPVHYFFHAGEDADPSWLVRRVSLVEVLGEPYELVVDLLTEGFAADPDDMVGRSAVVDIERGSLRRSVAGIVVRVDYLGIELDKLRLRVFVVPGFALLARRIDTRVFQDASAPEILAAVLEPGLRALGREVDYALARLDYPRREYCVQHRESDLAFVSRIMAEEGMSFYFATDDASGRERLVIVDDARTFPSLGDDGARPDEVSMITLRPELADRETVQTFDWTYAPQSVRPPAREGRCGHGRSNITGFGVGTTFVLAEHDLDGLVDQRFLLTRLVHVGECPYPERGGADELPRYENQFWCIPDAASFRPLRPQPVRIAGPQTATVLGPQRGAIRVDAQGRVEVRLHWDHRTAHEAMGGDTCWIRVAQTGFGEVCLPRVGDEVVVSFLEGDPDRPLVTGCVRNARGRDDQLAIDVCSDATPIACGTAGALTRIE